MSASFILFDLDNTLYPASAGVLKEMNRRIAWFVAEYFGVDFDEAEGMRKGKAAMFGTTLQWLRICHGLYDPEPFIQMVHPANMNEWVSPDAELREFLLNLPVDYALFTNSPREHALRTLDALGVSDLFPRIWDLRRLGYRGKPHRDSYERILGDLGLRAGEALLVDDSQANIRGFEKLGGRVLHVQDMPVSHWKNQLGEILRI